MILNLHSISEREAGAKWQNLFNRHWPNYRVWYLSKSDLEAPSLLTCQARLKEYMPEFYPSYLKFCELAGDDAVAHRFLTGYCPPPYMSGCAQVVLEKEAQLVRNYDYAPKLSEGTLFHSAWNGREVISMGDSLIGVIDGLNEDGLVVSLTFGGRKSVGNGFGIPFILRYVLEFCSTLDEAVKVITTIPSHMSYNIMLMDKHGQHRLIQVAPNSNATITDLSASTNHQGRVYWPEHASFTNTIERELYLHEMLAKDNYNGEKIAQAFLKPPLFNRKYGRGFGTIYTAIYRAKEGSLQLRWHDTSLDQSFDDFNEGLVSISFNESEDYDSNIAKSVAELQEAYNDAVEAYWQEYGKSWENQGRHHLEPLSGISQRIKELLAQMAELKFKQGSYPKSEAKELWRRVGLKK